MAIIGKHGDHANHQYDLTDFWGALAAHNLPAVRFLKAPGYQDGHAGYSSPLLEQQFIVDTINRLEKSSDWSSTAVVIAYDDPTGGMTTRWADGQRLADLRRRAVGPRSLRDQPAERWLPRAVRIRSTAAAAGRFAR